jgi:hypothetical protein
MPKKNQIVAGGILGSAVLVAVVLIATIGKTNLSLALAVSAVNFLMDLVIAVLILKQRPR